MQHFGLISYTGEVTSDENVITVSVTYNCLISNDFRKYEITTPLFNTQYNRAVLGRLLLNGLKGVFYNCHAPFKSLEGIQTLFAEMDALYSKLLDGNYGSDVSLPRHSGENHISAPALLFYLFRKPFPLTREEILTLTPDTLPIEWIRESKRTGNIKLYTNYEAKKEFREEYKREIRYISGLISQMKGLGKLLM